MHNQYYMPRRLSELVATLLLLQYCGNLSKAEEESPPLLNDEDWGDGLKVLTIFKPAKCEHRTKASDVVHYHYVGRLGADGRTFGKSFDYNSPYIVPVGHGRIIAGMDRGLLGMCLWERRRITIPAHLGYGERGVGSIIPPNSTLVFYVRLIKIERNGFSLGEDQSIESLWNSALASYTRQEWQSTVDLLEEALKLYHQYENITSGCLKKCSTEVSQLSDSQAATVAAATTEDTLLSQFLVYAARSRCVSECKAGQLSQKLLKPDSEVLSAFRQHEPYSYLHYSYFKLGNIEEGAKCLFTYCFSHTGAMCSEGLAYYRRQLGLKDDQVVYRIPGRLPHHEAYLKAKAAYEREEFQQSATDFENALVLYNEALDHCRHLCEDSLRINITQHGMSAQKMAKFNQHSLTPNSMEYYTTLSHIVREVIGCRIGCADKLATVEGVRIDNYLPNHFHYLQFDYYKLGLLEKAAETAATYLALDPSSIVMNENVRLYTTKLNVPAERFVPRKEYVSVSSQQEALKQLLHFAEAGMPKKREGLMGDPSLHSIPHQEL